MTISPSIWKLNIDAWKGLFQSRESALIAHYRDALRQIDPEAAEPATLTEARDRYVTAAKRKSPEVTVILMEDKIVIGMRVVALWQVFWMSLVPVLLEVVIWTQFIIPMAIVRNEVFAQVHDPIQLGIVMLGFVFLAVVLFYILFIVSLMIQGLFLPILTSTMNRYLQKDIQSKP